MPLSFIKNDAYAAVACKAHANVVTLNAKELQKVEAVFMTVCVRSCDQERNVNQPESHFFYMLEPACIA